MTPVSRETAERLARFESLVRKWNPAVQLVSRADLPHLFRRHLDDSAQLLPLAKISGGHWVDLGSGGGFPGLVVAILAVEIAPELRVTCIESDRRKATFLSEAVRELGLMATVLNQRIEDAPPQDADIVSARALAPLPDLLPLALRHLSADGRMIFPKGARYADEVDAARKLWHFDLTQHQSQTDPAARILIVENIIRA